MFDRAVVFRHPKPETTEALGFILFSTHAGNRGEVIVPLRKALETMPAT